MPGRKKKKKKEEFRGHLVAVGLSTAGHNLGISPARRAPGAKQNPNSALVSEKKSSVGNIFGDFYN